MGVRFHTEVPSRIPFEKIDFNEFEIESKIFHLSCTFLSKDSKQIRKEDFAKSIRDLYGVCKGCNNDKITKETDYLVIGKDGGERKPRNNCVKAMQWNSNPANKHIYIISQEHCEELISQYRRQPHP